MDARRVLDQAKDIKQLITAGELDTAIAVTISTCRHDERTPEPPGLRDARVHLLAAVIGCLLKQPRIADEYTLIGVDLLHGMLERRIVNRLTQRSSQKEKSFGEVMYDSGQDAPVQRTLTAFLETAEVSEAHREWLAILVQTVQREKTGRIYQAFKGTAPLDEHVEACGPAPRVQCCV